MTCCLSLCSALLALSALAATAAPAVKLEMPAADAVLPQVTLASSIISNSNVSRLVNLCIDPTLGDREAFAISSSGGETIRLSGGSPAGLLYAAQEIADRAKAAPLAARLSISQKPDFGLRGSVIYLMKDCSYDHYSIEPKNFPWFYDRPLLTKYLDYLFANRFNAIFVWGGNVFPSLVELPEYPDSTDLTREQLLQNQEQFRWFTSECAKRNISVLVHFYQIHIPQGIAKARGIPMHYEEPTDFVRKYMRYVLTRFLTEFDSVGLYACPGEVLKTEYQPEWIRDVIIAAAKDSGHNPVVVVRDWTLDADRFVKICVGQYGNLYTELKHNIEALVSPVPDERHRFWTTGVGSGSMPVQGREQLEGHRVDDNAVQLPHKKAGKKHIVNLHEITDIKPFRWGSPAYVREMVSEWKKIGLDGAEVYGTASWRWPYTLDKLSPEQSGFWPDGPKLLAFERDAIWLEAIGRYMWRTDRDPKGERAFWEARLAGKFGSRQAGKLILDWYETTGPILPSLENNWQTLHGNMAPTVLAEQATVDRILDSAKKNRYYPAKPEDLVFCDRYRKKYRLPRLTDRVVMSADVYADRLAEGEAVRDAMTPDKVVDLLVELAEEGVHKAEAARQAATLNRDEAARFVTDSQALVLVAQVYRQKVLAAIDKRLWLKTTKQEYAARCLGHLRDSVSAYEALVALTDKTYINATDIHTRWNWRDGLSAFRKDLTMHEQLFAQERDAQAPGSDPAASTVRVNATEKHH